MNANITQSLLSAQAKCELNAILFEKHTLNLKSLTPFIRKSRIENHSYLFLTAKNCLKDSLCL